MADGYPNDSDGDALRRVANDGSDMSRPMLIDFHVAMPDESAARALADVAAKLGYHVEIYNSPGCEDGPDDELPWTCQCSTRMVATYDGVIAAQQELSELSAPLDGCPDGWGTFGNRTNDASEP